MRFRLQTSYDEDLRLFRWGGERPFWLGLALYALAVAGARVGLGAGQWSPGTWAAVALVYAAVFAVPLGRHGRGAFWYGMLGVAVLSAPGLIGPYALSQLTFVCTYAIAGVGLLLLSGYAGQISLGHAAFMACGAYVAALLHDHALGILVSFPAAVVLSGALGVVIGLPALRMQGIYLAFATYAFAFIVEEILARWESVTGGNVGLPLDSPQVPGFVFHDETRLYYLALGCLVATLVAALNLLRTSTGRAFVAIRDSETAAQSMGVDLARYKTLAFAISAAMTGLAGALYAHLLLFIFPESFTIQLSIQLLVMVIVGGLGSLHGAVFGAIFLVVLPQAISIAREHLPQAVAAQTGLEPGVFGLILIATVVFEPTGLHGRWVKIKTYLDLFPLYRRGMFERQRSYMASERYR